MERYGSEWDAYLERDGTRIISLSSRRGSSLVSTPLPADKKVDLPYPYNMTFPLPPPTGQPQDFIPLPLASLQVIPGIGTTEPTPIVARLIGSDWQLFGTFYQGEGTSLAIRPSGNDPISNLPVMKVLGSLHGYGGLNLCWKDVHVLADLLKQ